MRSRCRTSSARIEAAAITVRFGSLTAVDRVSLAAEPGEVLAIVGENGAGKTTLMNVLFGLVRPTSGRVEVNGAHVDMRGPKDAIRAGIGMVHQHFRLVGNLTVAENVALGDEPRRGLRFDDESARARVESLASALGFHFDMRAHVEDLSVGVQQRVEIVKSLARGATTLILDEPTAVLTPQEADDLFAIIKKLQGQGTTVLFISHKLDEVKAIAGRIVVMRAGALVATVPASARASEIAALMVGHEVNEGLPRAPFAPKDAVLQLENVSALDRRGLTALDAVSLAVHAGEIVGVAGVEGNGQAELVGIATGLVQARGGRVLLAGDDVTRATPAERFARGLAHVPGDRLRDAVVLNMSVEDNVVLGRHRDRALTDKRFHIVLSPRGIHERALVLVDDFDVRPPDPTLPIRALSGGNQQKVVIARELSRAAKVLVAAHPTRGVDVGAVLAIHRRLLAERDRGAGVLLVSSDLHEILALADRVVVLYGGRLVFSCNAADTDERKLGEHMLGAASTSPLSMSPSMSTA